MKFVDEVHMGGLSMGDAVGKNLKLMTKRKSPLVGVGILVLISGCASVTPDFLKTGDEAPRKLRSAAQANWEKSGLEATAEYHFTLAQAFSSEGKVERAIEEYRAALAYDPQSSKLHAKLGAEYLKKGSTTFAIEECRKALDLDSSSIEVRLMLGGIYSLNNELDLALREYEQVLKADPENDEAAVFKTQVLSEQDKTAEALKFIKSFTAKVKDSAAAWFYVGKLEQAKDHFNEAIFAFRKAIEIRAGFSQASLALGLTFETHAQNQKAIEVYEAQMEEKPDMQVAGRLVTLYLKANQSDQAIRLLQTMSSLDPEDLNTRLRMGLLRMQRGEWGEAAKDLESLLAKVPDSDKVNYYLAAVYEQQGKTDATLEHLSKVSIDSKLFEDASLHAVGIHRRAGNTEKAFGVLKDAIKRSPENAGFYLVMASMYEDEKKNKDASQVLSDGLKVFPDHEKMRYFLGALLEKIGQTDEAVVQMEKILEKNPNHADALNFVAYTWTTQGVRLKDAEDMLKRAMKAKPGNAFILDSFGWNQFMLGKHRNALIYLEKAVGIKGDEETILQHLVEVYSKNQMPDRAQATRARIETLQAQSATRSPAAVDEK